MDDSKGTKEEAMCQKNPGPRCAADTRSVLGSLRRRIGVAADRANAALARFNELNFMNGGNASKKDVVAAKRQLDQANSKLADLYTSRRRTQRDFDGTKTGQRKLDALIAETHDDIMRQRYIDRKNQGKATYVGRQFALGIQEGTIKRPTLAFASDKVGEFN
jgi:hypothetical protein